ncbi:MAG: heavy metal translocating P-type ATPase [Bdellovibrionales bacterium]
MATLAYEYLDESSFRDLYCPSQDQPVMKFYIEGLKCSKCIAKIEGLKGQLEDLRDVNVDLAHHTARIELRDPSASFASVVQQVESLGFRAIPLQPQEDPTASWIEESRRDLMRLAVAGFCAGNIMTLAFAVYFGLEGPMRVLFEWIQLGLYLPVVSYVAWPFYQGLWQGLRARSLSIDGPMAIASFLGFAISTWNLLRAEGSIYYDSTSGFLFLILATRYFQKRTRFEYLKFLRPQTLSETFKARVKTVSGWAWTPSNRLQKGDRVFVEKGEWIPADGPLASDLAVVDLSLLDGESRPRWILKGFPVKAGARLLSDSAEVQVEKSGPQTLLGNLLSNLRSPSLEGTDSSTLSNRASQWLLGIVLSIGFALLIYGGVSGDFSTYFERAFALIVLACPCAMAFGTPLAYSFTMKKAQEEGIILKSARVFENLTRVDEVFFDKTGTLTDRSWQLTNSNFQNPPEIFQQIVLALEARSQHPVAFALREIWKPVPLNFNLEIENWETLPNGVQGTLHGTLWKFIGFQAGTEKWFGLFQENALVWRFQLVSQLRPGAREILQAFQKQGLRVRVLSGDQAEETQRVLGLLGLSPEQGLSDLTPQDKAQMIRNSPRSLMIGDGVNDALALQEALVGVAVQGGVDVALKSADALLLTDRLQSLLTLRELAFKAQRQIRFNLKLALFYNSVGGVAAMAGLINPFVAALLMPISSICILGATWWGTRR